MTSSNRSFKPTETSPEGSNAPKPRLVFVTQVVDADDPVLGATLGMIRALAPRCERLTVIANEVRSVPRNTKAEIVTLGKELGRRRLLRGWRYEAILTRLARTQSTDALIAHMCPAYLILAAPVTKAFRIPTVLWYAHPARTKSLLLAERLADAILTSLPGAFPLTSAKIQVVGQGIDTRAFVPSEPQFRKSLRLLALGRTSPSKNLDTAIHAVARARSKGIDVRLRIVGPSTTPSEKQYRESLQRLIKSLEISDWVSLEEAVSHGHVHSLLAESDVLVNAMLAGSGDKVVFEAMATGRPVLVSNPAFGTMLEGLPVSLRFPEGDPEQLSLRIGELVSASLETRREIGRRLRERVDQNHSTDRWAENVIRVSLGLGHTMRKVRPN